MRKIVLALAAISVLNGTSPVSAVPSFQQAVQEYKAGKYASALAEFEQFKQAYPSNGLVRYYEALCYQALNRLDKARSEYQWVAEHCTGKLQSLGETGLSKLANAKTQIAFAGGLSGLPGAKAGSAPSAQTSATSPTQASLAHSKVKRVIEFYTDW